MAGNTFGTYFKITTWGESHGKALGVVIDGCPAGLSLSEADIQTFLDRRKPGGSRYSTPRKEGDEVTIRQIAVPVVLPSKTPESLKEEPQVPLSV